MKGLSVIMPVYNGESYVSVMIECVMAQEYTDLELIVIDDGSNDGTLQIVEQYAAWDRRIRLAVQPENRGVSAARNLGLELAEGEYVAFVDADDRIHPSMYKKLIYAIEESNCDMAMCRIFYENGGSGEAEVLPNLKEGILTDNEYKNIINGIIGLSQDFFSGIWRYVFRNKVLGNKRFDTTVAYREDLLFLFELLVSRKKVYYVDLIGYYYVRNVASAAERYRECLFEELMYVNNRIFSLVKEKEILEDYDRLQALKVLQAVSLSISNLYRKDAPGRTTIGYVQQIRKFRKELGELQDLRMSSSAVKYRPLLLLMKMRAYWSIHMLYRWKEKNRQRKYTVQ